MEHIVYTEDVLTKILIISGHLSEVSQRANALMLSANPKLAGSAEWAGFFMTSAGAALSVRNISTRQVKKV